MRNDDTRTGRFAAFATHKRLKLLCEGLDLAAAIWTDNELAPGLVDDADRAFAVLKRGVKDALRLKDEGDDAYQTYFIQMTKKMRSVDIEFMWRFLFAYIRKRGRPMSKRQILEAIPMFLELAEGTSWKLKLEKLLPADLSPEYEEAFCAVGKSDAAAQPSPKKAEKIPVRIDKPATNFEDTVKRFAQKRDRRKSGAPETPKEAEKPTQPAEFNIATMTSFGTQPSGVKPSSPLSSVGAQPAAVKPKQLARLPSDDWWESSPPTENLEPRREMDSIDDWWSDDDVDLFASDSPAVKSTTHSKPTISSKPTVSKPTISSKPTVSSKSQIPVSAPAPPTRSVASRPLEARTPARDSKSSSAFPTKQSHAPHHAFEPVLRPRSAEPTTLSPLTYASGQCASTPSFGVPDPFADFDGLADEFFETFDTTSEQKKKKKKKRSSQSSNEIPKLAAPEKGIPRSSNRDSRPSRNAKH